MRTQSEVDGLWPVDCDTYTITGQIVALDATEPAKVARILQKFYDKGMAGSFSVKATDKKHNGHLIFEVCFTRDIHDDYDVVNKKLLEGGDFNKVLSRQILVEIIEGNMLFDGSLHVVELSDPKFSKHTLLHEPEIGGEAG